MGALFHIIRSSAKDLVSRDHLAIHLTGAVSLLAYGWLALLSREGTQEAGGAPFSVWLVLGLVFVPWVALVVYGFFHARRPWRGENSNRARMRVSWLPIVLWAILFRLVGVSALPMYEDDYFRFLWDGYVFAHYGDPYGVAPTSFYFPEEDLGVFQGIVWQINHPELPTIYGPVMEWVFLLSYWLKPASLVALKCLFLLFEAVALFYLCRMVAPRYWLYVAWCPLLVFETSFQAHPDIIGVAFMVMAMYFVLQKEEHARPLLAAALLGLAMATKVFALLALPFILRRSVWGKQLLFFSGVIVLAYLYFILKGSDLGGKSLGAMASEWEFNSSLYAILAPWCTPAVARILCLAAFVLIFGVFTLRYWLDRLLDPDVKPPLDIIYAVFLLTSPVVNPWYLLWLFPWVVYRLSGWGWVALAAVSLSYATGQNLGREELADFAIPLWVKVVEYGIVLLAVYWVKSRQWHRLSPRWR